MSESVKVVVRVRPMSEQETMKGCSNIIKIDEGENQITLTKPEEPENIKIFSYDHVFSATSKQVDLYSNTAYDLVENVLTGYNGTVFAYGQTGCGKTHSMVGKI